MRWATDACRMRHKRAERNKKPNRSRTRHPEVRHPHVRAVEIAERTGLRLIAKPDADPRQVAEEEASRVLSDRQKQALAQRDTNQRRRAA